MTERVDLKRLSAEINDAVEKFSEMKLMALGDLKQRQIALSSLMKIEAKRLSRKKGKDDPRVNRFKMRIAHNSGVISGLEAAFQVSSIRRPDVGEGEIIQQGRITDSNRLGISGLDVSLTDLQGKVVLPGLTARTDKNGYYAFIASAEDAKMVEESAKKGLNLEVFTEDGRKIHTEKDPLKLAAGRESMAEVVVERAKVFDFATKVTTVKEEKPVEREIKEKEETDLKKIKGIGPVAEAKLKKAGIKSVRDLAAADDSRIKAALGNVRTDLLRKEALSILKKTGKKPE